MIEPENIIDLFFDNIKHLFFPENWLQIDMKFSKFEIFSMLLIDKQQEITMTELSDYINTPMSTANGIIERLVNKGYVIRDRSDSDRRIVVLRLTEAGSHLIGGLKELISGYLKMAMEALSEEEIQTLVDIIIKIVRSLQGRMNTEPKPADKEIRKISIE